MKGKPRKTSPTHLPTHTYTHELTLTLTLTKEPIRPAKLRCFLCPLVFPTGARSSPQTVRHRGCITHGVRGWSHGASRFPNISKHQATPATPRDQHGKFRSKTAIGTLLHQYIYIYICMLIYIQYIQLAQLAHLLMCSDQLAHLTWPTGDQLDRIQAHRVASRPPRRVRASAERAQSGWALMDLGI